MKTSTEKIRPVNDCRYLSLPLPGYSVPHMPTARVLYCVRFINFSVKLVMLITVCAHPLACHSIPHISTCWEDTLYYIRSFDFLMG